MELNEEPPSGVYIRNMGVLIVFLLPLNTHICDNVVNEDYEKALQLADSDDGNDQLRTSQRHVRL